jgi:hypothetical protein
MKTQRLSDLIIALQTLQAAIPFDPFVEVEHEDAYSDVKTPVYSNHTQTVLFPL